MGRCSKILTVGHGISDAELRLNILLTSNGMLPLRFPQKQDDTPKRKEKEKKLTQFSISVRYQISSAQPINYSDEAQRLAGLISSYGLD